MDISSPFDADFLAYIDIDKCLADFIPEVAEQGFEEQCPPDFTPGLAEPSFEELCPQVQSRDEKTQEPLAKDTRPTEEASLNPVDNEVSVLCLSGSTVARPSELVVQASDAATVIGEEDVGESKLLTEEEQIKVV